MGSPVMRLGLVRSGALFFVFNSPGLHSFARRLSEASTRTAFKAHTVERATLKAAAPATESGRSSIKLHAEKNPTRRTEINQSHPPLVSSVRVVCVRASFYGPRPLSLTTFSSPSAAPSSVSQPCSETSSVFGSSAAFAKRPSPKQQ